MRIVHAQPALHRRQNDGITKSRKTQRAIHDERADSENDPSIVETRNIASQVKRRPHSLLPRKAQQPAALNAEYTTLPPDPRSAGFKRHIANGFEPRFFAIILRSIGEAGVNCFVSCP